MNGTKCSTEPMGYENIGRGAFFNEWSRHVSFYGRWRSENVGLSNENIGENPMPRKPKGSIARLVLDGLVGS